MSEFDRHSGTDPLPRKPCKFLTIKCLPFPTITFPCVQAIEFCCQLISFQEFSRRHLLQQHCFVVGYTSKTFGTYPLPIKPSRCLTFKCLQAVPPSPFHLDRTWSFRFQLITPKNLCIHRHVLQHCSVGYTSKFTTYSLPREPTKFLTQMFAILITGTIPCVQNIVANSSLPGIFSSSFAPTLFCCCWVHLQHRYLPITKIIHQISHTQMSAIAPSAFHLDRA
jgi:hypothetical protein